MQWSVRLVSLLSIVSLQVLAHDVAFTQLVRLTDKQQFLQYKENTQWISRSPKVTYIAKDDRDIFGNGSYISVTGYDCDRDGQVDEPPKCAILFKKLQQHFASQ